MVEVGQIGVNQQDGLNSGGFERKDTSNKIGLEPGFIEWSNKLSYKMHLTKGTRYQSARRHQKRSLASTWAVTALSMYVFSASSYLAVYESSVPVGVDKAIILLNIVMSAFIIAFSILEQGKKHDLKAELFLKCAQRIQELRDRLELDLVTGELDETEMTEYMEKYNEIVHDFSENHSESDYRTFRINIGKYDGKHFYKIFNRTVYWLDCWGIMLAAVLVPPVVVFAVLFF